MDGIAKILHINFQVLKARRHFCSKVFEDQHVTIIKFWNYLVLSIPTYILFYAPL